MSQPFYFFCRWRSTPLKSVSPPLNLTGSCYDGLGACSTYLHFGASRKPLKIYNPRQILMLLLQRARLVFGLALNGDVLP
jgi:hypothetical protein